MAHIHEKIDFTVSVYIVRDCAVLLHHHQKTGKWLPPGGHIELNEDPNEAAIREAKEETGFDIELAGTVPVTSDGDDERELIPPRFISRHRYGTLEHEHVDLQYFARVTGGMFSPEKGKENMRWFSRQEIEHIEAIKPRVRTYALAALDDLA